MDHLAQHFWQCAYVWCSPTCWYPLAGFPAAPACATTSNSSEIRSPIGYHNFTAFKWQVLPGLVRKAGLRCSRKTGTHASFVGHKLVRKDHETHPGSMEVAFRLLGEHRLEVRCMDSSQRVHLAWTRRQNMAMHRPDQRDLVQQQYQNFPLEPLQAFAKPLPAKCVNGNTAELVAIRVVTHTVCRKRTLHVSVAFCSFLALLPFAGFAAVGTSEVPRSAARCMRPTFRQRHDTGTQHTAAKR